MKWMGLACGAIVLAAGALAADGTGRANISGEWQQATAAGKDSGEAWVLDSKPDAIHVTQLQNGQRVAEYDCNTLGRECDVKGSGRHAKVSFYFNGPKLVQLETRGSEVVKRRFSVADQGNSMEVETMPIQPAGKPAVQQFKRVPVSAAQK
jgi:hypothetical protein